MHSQYSLSKLFVICRALGALSANFRFIYQTHLQCSEYPLRRCAPSYHFSCHILRPTTSTVKSCAHCCFSLHRFRKSIQSVSQCKFASLSVSQSVCLSLSQFSRFWICAPATTILDTNPKTNCGYVRGKVGAIRRGRHAKCPFQHYTVSVSLYLSLSRTHSLSPSLLHSFIRSHIQREQRRLWSANC